MRLNLSNLRFILIVGVSIKAVVILASPAGRAQIIDLIGSPSWAREAQAEIAGQNTGAEDAAGWGSTNGTGFDEGLDWDEAEAD